MASAGNLKKGECIDFQGGIWQVQKAEFYSPGKGSAVMRTRLRNVKSGKQIDYTFKSQEKVDTVDVSSSEMQYLYKDNESAHFMDNQTFQQYSVPLSIVGDVVDYFKEGQSMYVFVYEGEAVNITPPASVQLQVIETEDAARGDTVTNARKDAVVETGATVQVPLFIKKGEMISLNPETGQYTGRASS